VRSGEGETVRFGGRAIFVGNGVVVMVRGRARMVGVV
jgi:hypothetical protein